LSNSSQTILGGLFVESAIEIARHQAVWSRRDYGGFARRRQRAEDAAIGMKRARTSAGSVSRMQTFVNDLAQQIVVCPGEELAITQAASNVPG
jgi:hypothetical protein